MTLPAKLMKQARFDSLPKQVHKFVEPAKWLPLGSIPTNLNTVTEGSGDPAFRTGTRVHNERIPRSVFQSLRHPDPVELA
jgi:hypothetical protein